MKLTSFLLCSCLACVPNALLAQTKAPATPAKPHAAAPAAASASKAGCAKLPEISSRLPALPAGSSCFKSLFTIHQTQPGIKADYVSPLEPSDLLENLGLDVSYSLAYVDIKQGTGPLAEPRKWYSVKYSGYLAADGTKFDSSDDHPTAFIFQQGSPTSQPRPVIGFDNGFAGMHVGGKRRIFIPWQIGYRTQGNPPKIPGLANLVFDVELVSQSTEAPPGAAPAPPAAARPAPAPATAPPTPPAATAPQPQ